MPPVSSTGDTAAQAALALNEALPSAARAKLKESVEIERLEAELARLKQEKESVSAPWWRQARAATAITAILAAVMPVTTCVQGEMESRRVIAENEVVRIENAQQKYLDRIKQTDDKERAAILRFVINTSTDQRLVKWAENEITLVDKDREHKEEFEKLKHVLAEREEDNRLTEQLANAHDEAARKKIKESASLKKEIAALRKQQNEVQQRFQLPAPTPTINSEVLPQPMYQDSSEKVAPQPAPTILWVDDSPARSRFPRRVLEQAGGLIVSVPSTTQALAQFGKQKFDLIITDMARPGDALAGYTLIDQLKNQGSKLPVLIYAEGGSAPEHRQAAQMQGAELSTDDSSELLGAIARLLPGLKLN